MEKTDALMSSPPPEATVLAVLLVLGFLLVLLTVVVTLGAWALRAEIKAIGRRLEALVERHLSEMMTEIRGGNLTLTVRAVSVQHRRDAPPATVGYAKPARPIVDLGPLPDLSEPIRAEDATMPSSREIPGRVAPSGQAAEFSASLFPEDEPDTARTQSGDRCRYGSGRRDEEPLG
jgi:hypothetical protein